MSEHDQVVFKLCRLRVQNEYLEQDLSEALHLFYTTLIWIFATAPPEQSGRLRNLIHAKILQLPQASRLGQRLIELDEQSGGLLETHGVWLSLWVYEPRGICNE